MYIIPQKFTIWLNYHIRCTLTKPFVLVDATHISFRAIAFVNWVSILRMIVIVVAITTVVNRGAFFRSFHHMHIHTIHTEYLKLITSGIKRRKGNAYNYILVQAKEWLSNWTDLTVPYLPIMLLSRWTISYKPDQEKDREGKGKENGTTVVGYVFIDKADIYGCLVYDVFEFRFHLCLRP